MLKTHYCGELRKKLAGSQVTLAGWVDRRRDHGDLIFIDLRDRSGIAQVVFNPQISKKCHEIAGQVRSEFVLKVTGEVAPRPAGTENLKLPSGEVEVIVSEAEILNPSKTPPFYINEDSEVDENVRLKYRYLDLRRERMLKNLILRDNVVKFARDFLHDKGFLEIETPIMIKSTPEGARDYLVPSRLYPGQFYALPQSPQQLKQLLMVAGVEKYFQIAKCFRDEDSRADRQPEHTQLDIEMSFVDEEDILKLMEELFTSMIEKVKPDKRVIKPFPRINYKDAIEKYGSDKPDLRFGMEMRDLTDIAGKSEFTLFKKIVADDGKVKGICAQGCAGYTRNQLEELNKFVQSYGAGGLLTFALGATPGDISGLSADMVKSVAAKYMTLDQIKEMAQRLDARLGDLLLVVAGKQKVVDKALGELRKEMGQRLKLADPNLLAFAFIVNFPLFQWSEETKHWEPEHHPFVWPWPEDVPILEKDPGKVRAHCYDIVCNGFELASGSLRIHIPELQRRIFRFLGYKDAEIEEKFGGFLGAFEYGAPPHGGIAPGIDRLVMILAGESTIREVMAFPKNQNAVDLMLEAPSPVRAQQLKELHIRLSDD
ncbi:MAG: aspartate--tRNA ligase [Dehalococcoidales bacterium]|nr:aspartate--tRNA ligase [Dehalococcoidales bacterium]